MAQESDGIEEAFEGQLRVALTVAARIGEVIARGREEALRRAAAQSQVEAREMASRFEAERRAAHTELAQTGRDGWWENATPETIGHAYQTARAWANDDPEAARAEARMREELRARYGIDVDETGADPEAVRQLMRLEMDRALRDQANASVEAQMQPTAEATFSVTEFRDEAESTINVSKAKALSLIESTPDNASLSDSDSGGLHDIRTWIGKDHDVDRAIAEKFPELLTEEQRMTLDAETERRRAAVEEAEAVGLLAAADRADHEAESARAQAAQELDPVERNEAEEQAALHQEQSGVARADAEPLYDSAERRQATAADLESKGVSAAAIEAKMRADVSQAKPATEAAKGPVGKSPKARKSRGRAPQAQRSEPNR